jgi:hypothetical protein
MKSSRRSRDSFNELLHTMDLEGIEQSAEKNIHNLIETCIAIPLLSRNLSRIWKWLQMEMSVGAMNENDMNALLWNFCIVEARNDYNIEQKVSFSICKHLWEGIKDSKVRNVKNFKQDSIGLLLRAIAMLPFSSERHELALEIILSLKGSKEAPFQTLAFIDALLEQNYKDSKITHSGRENSSQLESFARYQPVIELLQVLPPKTQNVVLPRLLTLVLNLHQTLPYLGSPEELMLALSRTDILRIWVQNPSNEASYDYLNLRLAHSDIKTIATYLSSLSEADACKFIFKYKPYLPEFRHLQELRNDNQVESTIKSMGSLEWTLCDTIDTDKLDYVQLVSYIDSYWPRDLTRLLEFIYPLLRLMDRRDDLRKITESLFREDRFILHKPDDMLSSMRKFLSMEKFHVEFKIWTDIDPVFALELLSLIKREGIGHCTYIIQALTKAQNIPEDVLIRLVPTMFAAYKANENEEFLTNQDFSAILHLLAGHLTISGLTATQLFIKLKRISGMLKHTPEHIKPEMARFFTDVIVIKRFREKKRIPSHQLKFLSYWVCSLEGQDVWVKMREDIQCWWSNLVYEEGLRGRRWELGVGWVSEDYRSGYVDQVEKSDKLL